MVLNGAPPAERKVEAKPAVRSLAYENAIARAPADDAAPENAPTPDAAAAEPDIAPKREAKAEPAQPAAPSVPDATASTDQGEALPPDEGEESAASDDEPPAGDRAGSEEGYEPLPWQQHAARPDPANPDYGAAPPQGEDAYTQGGPPPQSDDPYGQADGAPYGQPPADPYAQGRPEPYGAPPGDPYGQANADPYGDLSAPPGQGGEEWMQVQVSGSAMRSSASDDAPMLFAFPYGRNLRVVSRYEDWVEVADPQSAATGWMKAYALAPSAGPAPAYEQAYDPNQGYQEEQPRRRPIGKGGFADMINRAFGGHN
jgi:hypothetical protein